MKIASFPQINLKRLYVVPFFLFISLMLSLTAFSQTPQLSLADILIGLRSKKVTLPERNKILADAIKVRGITFALTPEIEKELASTGADTELIAALRMKSPVIKPAATPVPKPVATPVPTPIPTPTPIVQDYVFYQKRANAYAGSGDFTSAITDYTKAIELKSGEPSAFLSRGFAFHNTKKYDLAIADYDKVIELNPKDASAYVNRANSYEKLENTEKAIADYKKAVELDAGNETAKASLKRLEDEQARLAQQKKETVPANEPSKPLQPVEIGQLNELVLNLVKPVYPEIARKTGIQGAVTVKITLDEEGKVISAKATEGPSMLRPTAEDAARKSKFKPAMVGSQAVKATGFITYSFKAN